MGSPYGLWTFDPTCRVWKRGLCRLWISYPWCRVWEEVKMNTVDVGPQVLGFGGRVTLETVDM